MQWQKVQLDNVCVKITDGAHASPPSQDEGFPMASVKDMTPHGLNLESSRKISSQHYQSLVKSGCKPEVGDVLIAKDGNSCLQTVCLQKQDQEVVLLSSVAILRPNQKVINPQFLTLFLSFERTKKELQNYVSGAAIPRVVLKDFKKYSFLLPPIETQKRIAEILSAYDDLIENNLKRIRLLEESARLLYREWFVRLKFPNHEHTPIIDGLPEGWRIGNVGDLAKVQSGFAFKSADWMLEGNPVIKIKNIDNNTINLDGCECISDEIAERAERFLLKEGDLLFAMSGATVGKVGLMPRSQRNYYLNQRVGILRPIGEINPNPFLFIILTSDNAQHQVRNFASGAAQPNISPSQIESIEFTLPSEKVLVNYLEFCEPMFKQTFSLLEQNQKLKQARDLLLPRLMSGEIAV